MTGARSETLTQRLPRRAREMDHSGASAPEIAAELSIPLARVEDFLGELDAVAFMADEPRPEAAAAMQDPPATHPVDAPVPVETKEPAAGKLLTAAQALATTFMPDSPAMPGRTSRSKTGQPTARLVELHRAEFWDLLDTELAYAIGNGAQRHPVDAVIPRRTLSAY